MRRGSREHSIARPGPASARPPAATAECGDRRQRLAATPSGGDCDPGHRRQLDPDPRCPPGGALRARAESGRELRVAEAAGAVDAHRQCRGAADHRRRHPGAAIGRMGRSGAMSRSIRRRCSPAARFATERGPESIRHALLRAAENVYMAFTLVPTTRELTHEHPALSRHRPPRNAARSTSARCRSAAMRRSPCSR